MVHATFNKPKTKISGKNEMSLLANSLILNIRKKQKIKILDFQVYSLQDLFASEKIMIRY